MQDGEGSPRNGYGVAAAVFGVLAIALSWTFYGGLLFGVLGLAAAIIGLLRCRRGVASNRTLSLAGLILAVLGLAATILLNIALTAVVRGSLDTPAGKTYQRCMASAGHDHGAQARCLGQFRAAIGNGSAPVPHG
ncbi:MAG: hypothetical protein ACRDRL_26130 [Sciscionella sp.]